MRSVRVSVASAASDRGGRDAAERATGRPRVRRGRSPRATCSFPPYQIADAAQRPAGRRGAASRAAGRQHADDRARRQRARSQGTSWACAQLTAALLDQGTATSRPSRSNDDDRFHGRRDRRRRRHRSELRQHDRDEGQLRRSACGCCPTSRAVRRSRREEIERQRQQTLSGLKVSLEDPEYIAERGVRSAGLRLPSVRHAADRHAANRSPRITRDDLRRVPPPLLRAEQRHPRRRRRRHRGRGVRRRDEGLRRLGARATCRPTRSSTPPEPTRRVVIVNKPDAVQTEIRVGHIGIQRKHPDYMALDLAMRILGGEGANRLHQVLRTAARADLRRAGRYGHAAARAGDFEA